NATPSGNSVAISVLFKLGRLTGEQRYTDLAERALRHFASSLQEHPLAHGQLLMALDEYLGPAEEFVIVPALSSADLQTALALVQAPYRPRKLVAVNQECTEMLPLFQQRPARDGQVTVYHCHGQTCDQPWIGLPAIRQGLISSTSHAASP